MTAQHDSEAGPRPGAVLILGMHRSGTSCLAGCLEEAGLYLGEVKRQNPDNPKGNRENRRIMELQDALLQHHPPRPGGPRPEWYHPPEGEVDWTPEFEAERDRIIASYPADRRWGFKDPRTVFTLTGWLRRLPGARLVASFRHPMAVARSLEARDGFPIARGLALWQAYNRRLLEIARAHPLGLISFDLPGDRYGAALRALCHRLDLTPPPAFRFFEADLRNSTAGEDADLPADVAATHAALRDLAEGPRMAAPRDLGGTA